MNIAYIGTGYVGTVSGAITAKKGHKVYCVDLPEKVKQIHEDLAKGKLNIYEPGLKEIVEETLASGKLSITDSLETAVKDSSIIFITVGTPPNPDGSAKLDYVYSVADGIAKHANSYKIIVVKSTVPPGTTNKVKKRINEQSNFEFDIAMNPEFLREGRAVEDTERPDRIILGVETKKAEQILRDFYRPFTLNNNPILVMSPIEAEIVKLASNAHLATRISISNEIANLCTAISADYKKIVAGIGSDHRIGKSFLHAGIGYGGSCFPKDVQSLIHEAKQHNVEMTIFEAVHKTNERQKLVLYERIKDYFRQVNDKTFGIWGLSFKPETDDIREAPSLSLIEKILSEGGKVKAYDPKAMDNVKKIFGERITLVKSKEEAVLNCDALILCTEWDQFREPDFTHIKNNLKNPVIFDGRNVYDPQRLKELGIKHIGIGVGN